jgi:predicted transcriptional regulator
MEEIVVVLKKTSFSAVATLIKEFEAMLVQKKVKVVGIINSTDLIGHKPKKTLSSKVRPD